MPVQFPRFLATVNIGRRDPWDTFAPMRETSDDPEPRDDATSIRRDLIAKLHFELAKFPDVATRNDQYLALAYAVRDRLLARWIRSARTYFEGKHRSLIYLSAEYLIGPQLGANLLSLGLHTAARTAAPSSASRSTT